MSKIQPGMTGKGDPAPNRIAPEVVREMRAMRRQGLSKKEIARRLGVGDTTVGRYTTDIEVPTGGALSCPEITDLLASWPVNAG